MSYSGSLQTPMSNATRTNYTAELLKSVFLSLSDKHHPEISESSAKCGTSLLRTWTHANVYPKCLSPLFPLKLLNHK